MTWLRVFVRRLRGIFLKRKLDLELEEEIRAHLAMQTEDNERRGMSPEEARRAALRQFGGVEQIKERYRERRGLLLVESALQDLRYAVRSLRKNPGFTFVAVFTLALGIGVNIAIFSVVDALLLRPLPGIAEPSTLVTLGRTDDDSGFDTFSYPDYLDYRDQISLLTGLAAFYSTPLHLSTGSAAERVSGATVSGNYFDVLGVRPVLGRLLSPSDDRHQGAHPVAVISHGLWQRRFSGDPQIVGKQVSINSYPFTVTGVAPEDFTGTKMGEAVDVWLPLMMQAQAKPVGQLLAQLNVFADRRFVWLKLVGRLKEGASLPAAKTQASTLAAALASTYSESNQGRGVRVAPGIGFDPETRAGWASYMRMLLIVVGLVLAVACANVANLLLARGLARRKELGIRLALGSGRLRLMRQLLIESLLLACLGGACGLILAYWTTGLLPQLFTPSFSRSLDFHPNLKLFAFALLMSLLTGVIFGILPALQAVRVDLVPALKEGTTTDWGAGRSRLRESLVVVQIALSLMLLVGAGLFTRTLLNLQAIEPGFATHHVLISSFDLGLQGYDEERGRSFFGQLVENVRSMPGVEAVSLARILPLGGGLGMPITVEGRELPPDGKKIQVNFNVITPSFFETMKIPLVRGRDFNERDVTGQGFVTIINETMAARLFPGEDPLGKRVVMPISMGKLDAAEIVGVAQNIKYRSLLEQPPLYLYLPAGQRYDAQMTLFVRTTGEAARVAPFLGAQVQRLDKELPVYGIMTLAERLRESFWRQKTASILVGICGLFALVLASVGLYGVMSYNVARRAHEIGVRIALGASGPAVLALFIRRAMLIALAGITAGTVMALIACRFVSNQLYGLGAADPATFVGAALLLAGVAAISSFIPARRATKVDPLNALRYE